MLISRTFRTITRWMITATVPLPGMMLSTPSAAQERLIFASTGGQYEQLIRKQVAEPFTAETGIQVTFVAGSLGERWGRVKAMAEAGHLKWDLMEIGSVDPWTQERSSLLLDLGETCDEVPKAKSDGFSDTCQRVGVLPGYGATLLVANSEMFKGRMPESWSEFFNVKDFPGPRSLSNVGDPWRVLVGALLADGVEKGSLFPLDLDRAFRKLDQIRPHISLWWRSGDQIQRAIRDKEVAAALLWNTRTAFLRKEGMPLQRIWSGATLNLAYWAVFRNAPHEKTAVRFLKWYFDHPEVQVAFTRAAALSPSTRSALALMSAEEQSEQPGYPENLKGIVRIDYDWLGKNNERILRRWNAWLVH